MVSFYHAYTAPINPPNASPLLTRAQVWEGLQRKIRFPSEFVPAIIDGKVLNETDKPHLNGTTVPEVERRVQFAQKALTGGEDKDGWLREVVRSYEPAWVDFHRDDGSVVRNLISDGPEGGDENLQLTYIFEWHHPELDKDSEEAKKLLARYTSLAKLAVDGTTNKIRHLVNEGQIK